MSKNTRLLFRAIVASVALQAGASMEALAQEVGRSADRHCESGQVQEGLTAGYLRIAGIRRVAQYATSYDRSIFPTRPIEESASGAETAVHIAGPVRQTVFEYPAWMPKARVLAFYRNSLQSSGYEIVFHCGSLSGCGEGFGHFLHSGGPVAAQQVGNIGYLPFGAITASRGSGRGEKYVFVYIAENSNNTVFEMIAQHSRHGRIEAGPDVCRPVAQVGERAQAKGGDVNAEH